MMVSLFCGFFACLRAVRRLGVHALSRNRRGGHIVVYLFQPVQEEHRVRFAVVKADVHQLEAIARFKFHISFSFFVSIHGARFRIFVEKGALRGLESSPIGRYSRSLPSLSIPVCLTGLHIGGASPEALARLLAEPRSALKRVA